MQKSSIILLMLMSACFAPQEDETGTFYQPIGFPEVNFPATNDYSAKRVELGKTLFFDQSLSLNHQVSCASCHLQEIAFTDAAALSKLGVTKKPLLRHTPALINMAWAENGLFWDGGAKNLESLVFAPLTHQDEMGANLVDVENYVNENKKYQKAFKEAYGVEKIKSQYVAKAIAQYVRTIVSDQSKYDSVRRGVAVFTEIESKGYQLFIKNCSTCHTEPLMADNQFHNNGLDSVFTNAEEEGIFQGRFRITHDTLDLGKYKTPTLRNVALTAPYMHDGRFETLEEVLDHYSGGVKYSNTLDSLLYNAHLVGITLTETDKQALLSFLNSLTDFHFINNSQYRN